MKETLIDIETYCETDIKKCGLYRYVSDPSFEILLIAWATDEGSGFGETRLVDLASGEPFPQELLDDFKDSKVTLIAHNAAFERVSFTLTAIQDLMLNTFEVNKVLIIAPLRVARDTWPAEIEKWDHLKNLDISIVVGDVKTRIAAVHHPAMIYVVNRENVKWLVEYYEKNGMRWDFSMVVIDELSSFKNYQSQRFKFLRKVRPYVKRWVGLTGTPSSNGLMDLWAEIGILDGGERLGKFIGRYREAYVRQFCGPESPAEN